MLVAHGGVGVAAASCGRSSSSLLFLRCFFSLFLLFPLSTMFFPLCSGFVELLVVAAWGVAWTVVGLSSFSSMCFFFCSVLLCFCFLLLFLTVLLATGRTVAAGGDDDGRATVALLCGGGQCFAAVFFVCAEAQVSAFSSMVLQRGKKMVS